MYNSQRGNWKCSALGKWGYKC